MYGWARWEQAMNPSCLPFGGPPTGVAAGGWVNWRTLHLALVDLYALRKELITHWGLARVVGAKTVRLCFEAIGEPGSGERALFVRAEKGPSANWNGLCPTDH